MAQDNAKNRTKHFSENWLTWVALHHFLPASLLRELAYVIVDRVSDGELSFEQLFDEAGIGGQACLDPWLIKPLKTDSPLARYLQFTVRAFVWQSDTSGVFGVENLSTGVDAIASILNKAVAIGSTDFMNWERVLGDFEFSDQPSFAHFIRSFRLASASFNSSNDDEFVTALENKILPIEMPLAVVALKHFGDLCADVDAWGKAQASYERAEGMLADYGNPAWEDLISSIRAIITQSRAAAIRTIAGNNHAAEFLQDALDNATMRDNILLFGNASFDAYAAAIDSSFGKIPSDLPTHVLLPPLLHRTHSITPAIERWLAADFDDSHRHFWAVLRRQIALGSATESRFTKSLYARSIIDGLDLMIDRQGLKESFQMAICLLLESGNSGYAKKIRWNERLVGKYVDQRCVDLSITHSHAHTGAQLERRMVLVELFQAWAELISIEHADVATNLLKHIAMLALEPVSFFGRINLGGRSLEALTYLAQKRPELRHVVVSEVAAAVSEKLASLEFRVGTEVALQTAIAYLDVFTDPLLRVVLDSTLSLLDRIDPKAGLWPVVRVALNLLIEKPIKRFVRQIPDLERRIISTILRFGMEQESEHSRVMFYLHDFNPELLGDSMVRKKLQDVVEYTRKHSTEINSSNVVVHIQSLLLAPAISGKTGVEDALNGLILILRSAKEKHPSIALPSAYAPLLLLADRQQAIARDISVNTDTFRSWLQPIVPLVTDLWTMAKERPVVFAGFSIPPASKPDPIIVHNWAFASTSFAESLQENEKLQAAITLAATQPDLRNPISLARATRAAAGKSENLGIEDIRSENRDAFYSALGRRLALLHRLDPVQGIEVCKALLDQCLRLGPRDMDAAIFLSVDRLKLGEYVLQPSYFDYMKRLDNNRELRSSLAPILEIFRNKQGAE
jgi:hypothetical protein